MIPDPHSVENGEIFSLRGNFLQFPHCALPKNPECSLTSSIALTGCSICPLENLVKPISSS